MFNAVYFIDNIDNGMFYIGSTSDAVKREEAHFYQLSSGTHHNRRLQADYDKGDRLEFSYFECRDIEEAREEESKYISRYIKTGLIYNIASGSGMMDLISHHPDRDSIVKKISDAVRRRYSEYTNEDWARHSERTSGANNGMYGRTHTPEVRKRLSDMKKGKPGTTLGMKHSAATKATLSAHAKTRTGNKNSFFGKKHSQETKDLIRSKNLGVLPPNTRPVIIDGKEYVSATAAMRATGIHLTTILHRIKSSNPKFINYRFK